MFREAYRTRRCVAAMDAYLQRDAAGKRHALKTKDGALFGCAAIWENWRNPRNGEWERTFAIITTEANALVAAIHDRMPLILHRADIARWLSTEPDPRDLLRPYPSDLMIVEPVGHRRCR
jgi:putative SOS response-associated peptidase YedK